MRIQRFAEIRGFLRVHAAVNPGAKCGKRVTRNSIPIHIILKFGSYKCSKIKRRLIASVAEIKVVAVMKKKTSVGMQGERNYFYTEETSFGGKTALARL